jgi:preprotein translocase subunit SecG
MSFMGFLIGILTVLLVINCALLILLVLVQLPKKDAGAGLAFGGGAADALFGAGSGNVLTKVTKWATVVFFVMALFLGFLQDRRHKDSAGTGDFEKQMAEKQMQMATPQPMTPPASQPAAPASTNILLSVPSSAPTNAPEAPAQSK